MEITTIKKLIKVSQNHRDGKWFIPSVAALLEIDGSEKYSIENEDEFVQQVDKQLYERFLGVYQHIEDWVDIHVLEPLRTANTELIKVLNFVDKTKLAEKYILDRKINYKKINNYIYVFKL